MIGCKQYIKSEVNEEPICLRCDISKGYNIFAEPNNTCSNVNIVDKCKFGLTYDQCEQCVDGYELTIENKCDKITEESSSQNCLNIVRGECKKCKVGYVLTSSGGCFDDNLRFNG